MTSSLVGCLAAARPSRECATCRHRADRTPPVGQPDVQLESAAERGKVARGKAEASLAEGRLEPLLVLVQADALHVKGPPAGSGGRPDTGRRPRHVVHQHSLERTAAARRVGVAHPAEETGEQ
eukprot:scaffold8250_cov194-Isochrysis_galbana.AAC.2